MKKLSIWLLSTLAMLIVLTSCEINEEFDRCPELAFTFHKLDAMHLEKVNDTISNDSLAGYYKFTADFPNIEETAYEWFVNDSLLDSELILDDRDNMYVGFFEPGIYTICIFSETPECPEGTSYCKTLRVGVSNSACPQLMFVTRTDTLSSGKVDYKFIADFEGIEEISYGWFINGDLVEDSAPGEDNYLRWNFEKPGVYEVCIKTETPECPEGTSYCEAVRVGESNTDCPEISFEIEQEGNSFGYKFYPAAFEGIDDPNTTLEWYANDQFLGKSDEYPHNNPFYTQLAQGQFLICLVVKTENCPEGKEWCKLLQVGDVIISCPELSFEIEQQGDSTAYMFFPGNFEGVEDFTSDWFVNEEYVGSSIGQQDPLSYQFEAGRHEVCLLFETPECPEGIKKCIVIEISDPAQE